MEERLITKRQKPFILFITGVSGVGKTAVGQKLASRKFNQPITVRDIDENGVPSRADRYWRKYRVEELLCVAIENAKKGKSTIVCGVIYPFEIVDSEYYHFALNIHYVLLEISDQEFSRRILKRFNETKKNRRIKKLEEEARMCSGRLRNQFSLLRNSLVIDAENNSLKQVEAKIAGYILKLS